MDNDEKISQCRKAHMIRGRGYWYCKVYGRTVGCCRDCAFSTIARPLHIQGR